MSIVVTGGAGFIGSMLCRLLVERGDDVVVIDNLRNGQRKLIDVLGPKARLLEVDIRNAEAVRKVIKDTRPQGICHLAAIHFIPYCNRHPLEALDINVQGTLSVLEACKAAPPKMVVIASSAAVYDICDGPSVLKSRRIAWHLSNSGTLHKLHHQHLMMLALSNEMKERAAVAKERVIAELFRLLSEEGEYQNRSEYFTLRDLQSRADIGFQRTLRTCFLDRSPAYDNDLLTFGSQIPVDWKKDGRIVRRALRLANPKLAWINDANTGLPAGLCPPWNRILGSTRKVTRDVARWLSRYSKIVASYRDALPGCKIFSQNSSWHDMNGMLRLCGRYRSMVESTIEQLDEAIFDKSMIVELLRDDLSVRAPRLPKLFEIVLTFGLFDKKWGPSASRNATSGEIANMKIVDLGDV